MLGLAQGALSFQKLLINLNKGRLSVNTNLRHVHRIWMKRVDRRKFQ